MAFDFSEGKKSEDSMYMSMNMLLPHLHSIFYRMELLYIITSILALEDYVYQFRGFLPGLTSS